MLLDGVLDRAQAPHPGRRPAERRAPPTRDRNGSCAAAAGAACHAPGSTRDPLRAARAHARSRGVSGRVAPWLMISLSVLGSTSARVQSAQWRRSTDRSRTRSSTPSSEARRRLALAQIRQYPDAALKMAARPVEEFDDDLRRLVERMKQLMVDAQRHRARGDAGRRAAAAVRLPGRRGRDRRARKPGDRGARRGERLSRTRAASRSRACSLPVERPATIVIEGRNEHGSRGSVSSSRSHTPRVAQHEADHLDGVLILDRTTPEARREALASLRPRIVIG